MSRRPVVEAEREAVEFGNSFRAKKVLVTGGAGFLGSWACEMLLAAGARVDCLDNFSTGSPENVRHLAGKMRMIKGDVETAQVDPDYDYIFHMSSRASPEEYQTYPIETLRTNSMGTTRILELAKNSSAVMVYASTSEIYGDAKVIPTPESYFGYVSSMGVRSCYDEGKRFGEAMSMAYFREHKVHIKIPRIFNSYGPRIRADGIYGRVVPRFVLQALSGEPITIHGRGTQTRSFSYVTDTIRGLLLLAISEGTDGEAFNVGNPTEMTIRELAEEIIRLTGSKSKLRFVESREEDPKRRCPDISKIKKLGWRPKVKLADGLSTTIAHFEAAQAKGKGAL
ncbi:MAG TPA: NAD-dependent epimerase/dehydratase family protein [Nitrososphaerales archaeon]|nr:NAD-dependent epimerase/dehydratase family protein [Nitrososphaerales archaeon]